MEGIRSDIQQCYWIHPFLSLVHHSSSLLPTPDLPFPLTPHSQPAPAVDLQALELQTGQCHMVTCNVPLVISTQPVAQSYAIQDSVLQAIGGAVLLGC